VQAQAQAQVPLPWVSVHDLWVAHVPAAQEHTRLSWVSGHDPWVLVLAAHLPLPLELACYFPFFSCHHVAFQTFQAWSV
jgi:hypothetical protein